MLQLQQFSAAADRSGSDSLSVVLTQGQQDVSARTQWRERLVERFQSRDNRDVTVQFVEALKTRYGIDSANAAVESSRLDRNVARGKPLRARQIKAAVAAARLRSDILRSMNDHLAGSYRNCLLHGTATSTNIRTMIEEIVRWNHGGDDAATWLVDFRRLSGSVHDAIQAEGRDGEDGFRWVSQRRAAKICRSIVEEEFKAAVNTARNRALQALNPWRTGSTAHRELAVAFAGLDPTLVLRRGSLSPDAAEAIYSESALAIDAQAIRADELDDENVLRPIAREKVGVFMAGREAARARVRELECIDAAGKGALLEQVTCDTIPEHLVAPLGDTYLLVRDELARIARPLPPDELQDSMQCIHQAIASTWQKAGIRLDTVNEELAYRHAWRFLLAPGGSAQAGAILGQLASPESPVRDLCQAVNWYANTFSGTNEAKRTLRQEQRNPNVRIHDEKSFQLANEYSKTLLWLEAVAEEKAGPEASPAGAIIANPKPTDHTVATLRDLGIPFPAPERLGQANNDVPLSLHSLDKMQQAIDRKVAATPELHRSGVTNDCVKFLRANELTRQHTAFKAQFTIDGVELPSDVKAGTVVSRLRALCTDAAGNVNRDLLANISRMVNHHTFDCLYSGCMNPLRPDLSIMNGYPRGVMLGHAYELRKNEDGEVQLSVSEAIAPLKFYPAAPNAGLMTAAGIPDEAGLEWVRLNGHDSEFQIVANIDFDAHNYKPQLKWVGADYCLIPGDPHVAESDYWTTAPHARGEAQVAPRVDRETAGWAGLAGAAQGPASIAAETLPEFEPLYSPIRLHRPRRHSSPEGLGPGR